MSSGEKIRDSLYKSIYHALGEGTDDLLYILGRDGTYLEFNERGLRNCGFERDAVVGRKPSEAFDAKLADEIESNNRRVIETGRPMVTQDWMDVHGAKRCYSTSLTPIKDEDGEVMFVVGCSHDITDAKRMVEELRIYEQQVENLFAERAHMGKLVREVTKEALTSATMDGFLDSVVGLLGEGVDVSRVDIFSYDPVGSKASCTHEWCAAGIPSSIDLGQDIRAEDQPWCSEEMLAGRTILLNDSGEAPSEELRGFLDATGVKAILAIPIFAFGKAWGFISFDECRSPRKWDEMEVELLSAIVRVISQKIERHRLEENILSAERLAATGRLVAAIAHEINNPLQGVLLHVESLEEMIPEEGRQALKRMKEGIGQISGIVSNLLQTHRGEKDSTPVDVNSILKDAFDLVSQVVDLKGVSVKWYLDEDLPPFSGDNNKLRQVFLNIMLNSLDSMDKGGELFIATAKDECHIVVEVRDTGCGIQKEALPYIFDPFYTTKGKKGTGLGLFVTHSIISEHGGRIEVSSGEGEGTDVMITLPIGVCDHVKMRLEV